jgi:hypothetical protein
MYVAVRDRNWGTLPAILSNLQMVIGTDSFHITYTVENQQGEIDFAWQASIIGSAQGTLEFHMDGMARTTFLRNRIGFCVLHPAGCAGAACRVEHIDGSIEEGCFPGLISPDQPVHPFAEMRSLAHQVAPGMWAEVRFNGDIFEMEDQRNWTDASFKTFSTPLRLPYPVKIQAGTHIDQSILLQLKAERTGASEPAQARQPEDSFVHLDLHLNAPGFPIPPIGLGVASHGHPLSQQELARLDALHLDHLRVDLPLADTGYPSRLRQAMAEAETLGAPLDIALLLSPNAERDLDQFKQILERLRPRVRAWLVYPERENFQGGSPTRQFVELAQKGLGDWRPSAKWAAGANTDFIFLQRTPPPVELIDVTTLAINPQVHAFDHASLVETLETQGAVVSSARRLVGGLPVMISPITLKPRFNPYANSPQPALLPGELPAQVDVRQRSLLGAGWTLGSLKSLIMAGACSLTYYETTGWRGVMETEHGSPLLARFPSSPGEVFPLYSILWDVGQFTGGEALACISSNHLAADGMVLRKGERVCLLLANYTNQRQTVCLSAIRQQAHWRSLDETNAGEYFASPETFLSLTGDLIKAVGGEYHIILKPYAVARLEAIKV